MFPGKPHDTKQCGRVRLYRDTMPCLLVALILLFPRIAIVLLYLFTNFFSGVYDNILLPLIGFIVLPITLVAYTYLAKAHHPMDTTAIVILFVAVILDLGLLGGGEWRRRAG
jgi:hypothetical protein